MANEDGLTVLHNAVCSGCLDVLEFLIENGCDVNVADSDGWYVFSFLLHSVTQRFLGLA
jgi:ankyrin repeat protein